MRLNFNFNLYKVYSNLTHHSSDTRHTSDVSHSTLLLPSSSSYYNNNNNNIRIHTPASLYFRNILVALVLCVKPSIFSRFAIILRLLSSRLSVFICMFFVLCVEIGKCIFLVQTLLIQINKNQTKLKQDFRFLSSWIQIYFHHFHFLISLASSLALIYIRTHSTPHILYPLSSTSRITLFLFTPYNKPTSPPHHFQTLKSSKPKKCLCPFPFSFFFFFSSI